MTNASTIGLFDCGMFAGAGVSSAGAVSGSASSGIGCGTSVFPSFVTYTGISCPSIERTISYREPSSDALTNSASAPCAFANSRTFCPASSALIVAAPVSPPQLVNDTTNNRIARTTVESIQ